MQLRLEDQPLFHRSVLRASAWAALAGAAATVTSAVALVPLAAAGCAVSLLGRGKAALACAVGAISCAVAALLRPDSAALLGSGALLGLGLAAARLGEAGESGARKPGAGHFASSAVLGAAVLGAAGALLPPFASLLAHLFPASLAFPAAGAVLGLWAAAVAAPLYLTVALDPVEARLGTLRAALGAELRPLADRAVSARRAALEALVDKVPTGSSRQDLRALLESLALLALDLARRAAELTFAAQPALEEELRKRAAGLTQRGHEVHDQVARASWLRAAETVEAQLAHCRSVRLARERLVARVHEEVSQLERARFSLLLLGGVDELRTAVELDLLGARLQQGVLACEAAAECDHAG